MLVFSMELHYGPKNSQNILQEGQIWCFTGARDLGACIGPSVLSFGCYKDTFMFIFTSIKTTFFLQKKMISHFSGRQYLCSKIERFDLGQS